MSFLPNDWLVQFLYRQNLRELFALLLRYGVCAKGAQRTELVRSVCRTRRNLHDLGADNPKTDDLEMVSELWSQTLADLALEGWRSYQQTSLQKLPWPRERLYSDWLPEWDTAQEVIGEAIFLPDQITITEDEQFLRKFIQDHPDHAQAFCNLSVRLMERRDEIASERLFLHALALDPDAADTLLNYAVLLTQQGRLNEAENFLRKALSVRPDYIQAYCNLGYVLSEKKCYAESESVLRKALALQPDSQLALINITVPLFERKAYSEALEILQTILRHDPKHRGAALNRVACLFALGEKEAGEKRLKELIEEFPDDSDAMVKLALFLAGRGDEDDAYFWFQRAYQVSGFDPTIGFEFALFTLSLGRFSEGFELYEHRFEVKANGNPIRFTEHERWNGGALDGKRILIHAEQGLGDLIQFVRYVSILKERGGRVLLETREPLLRLFQGLTDMEKVFLEKTDIPPFDLFAPIASLPHLCGSTLATLPHQVPYLKVDPEWVNTWSPHIPKEGLRVGIVWSANPVARNVRDRSMSLTELAPLAKLPYLRLLSLQKGEEAEAQITEVDFEVLPLGSEIKDFADTAAIISQLDLVLTIDTSVAHLAGALNAPTWVMLPYDADWRWLRHRDDSPWYPSVRLFRQPTPGDWHALINIVTCALEEWAAERIGN